MSQQKLPFSKREYQQRMLAVESIQSADVSRYQLGRIRFLIKHVFKHSLSSCEGDLTFVQANAPAGGQFSLADDLQVTQRTLNTYLRLAESLGVIATTIDCDGRRIRRTTMSIEWTEISKLSGVKFGSRQTENPASQTANYERQTANSASQTETFSVSSISKNKEPKSQPCEGDFESLLVAVGIGDRNVVAKAIDKGATAADCLGVLQSAIRYRVPAGVVHGRLMAIGDNPSLTSKPWPAAVAAAQQLRKSDQQHYANKARRREAIEHAGCTANSESIAEVLCDHVDEIQAAAELERLEQALGQRWELMPSVDQNRFAESVLSEFDFRRWIQNRDRCRFELLEALEQQGATDGKN